MSESPTTTTASWPEAIVQKVARMPMRPGVYLMRGHKDEVLYVGKAKRLRNRVSSYLRGGDGRAFIPILPKVVGDIEVIEVGSEKEALLLENELIKRHLPVFNALLKDDKSFITLRLGLAHKHPRLTVWRKPAKDKAKYFGPYASAKAVRETLRLINRHFQLRTCSDKVLRSRKRACLQFQIGRCPAPCVREVPDYDQHVEDTRLFLSGHHDALLEGLRGRMAAASERLAFEEAARLRDQIRALERTLERQQVISVNDLTDRDVFGVYREGPSLEVQLLRVRGGRLIGGRAFSFSGQEFPTPALLGSIVQQLYAAGAAVPGELLLPDTLEDVEPLTEWLSESRGAKVRVTVPQRGEKRALLDLAMKNARTAFTVRRQAADESQALLESLQRALRLRHLPRRIEGYDISQVQGTNAVASRVAITEGLADPSRYRRYKIREVQGQDDFAMMREVLTRRLLRGVEEGDLPDLIVVDGGKGQLGVARAVMQDLGIDDVELIGLAKGRALGGDEGGRTQERVFVSGRKDPIVLRQDSAELFVLTRLRDESHRFAITYHRKERRKQSLGSELEAIPGIGSGRRKALLLHFGSLKRLKAATLEALAEAPGISLALATRIHAGLRSD